MVNFVTPSIQCTLTSQSILPEHGLIVSWLPIMTWEDGKVYTTAIDIRGIISSSINESVQAQPASSADVTSSTTPTSSSELVTGPAIVDGTFEEFERFLALNHEDGKVHSSEPSVTFAGSHDDAAAVKSHPTSATGLCPFRHGTVYGKSWFHIIISHRSHTVHTLVIISWIKRD